MSNDINESGVNAEGLPSVNDHDGSAASSLRGKFIGMGILAVLLAAVVGGGYYAAVKLRQGLTGRHTEPTQPAMPEMKRRTFDDAAPPLPASLATAASAPAAASSPVDAKPVDVKPVGNGPSGQQIKPVKIASRFDSGILLSDDSGGTASRAMPISFPVGAAAGAGGDSTSAPGAEGGSAGFGGGLSGGGGGGALSGLLTATVTPVALASKLVNLSLMMPKTTPIMCALRGAIDSGRAGQSSCTVVRDMLSADGKVVLVDRGSVIDLEYGPVTKQGQRTVALLGSRIRTPSGVVIDIGSLAADGLGRSGAPGYVDNHWGERIGAALLLAMVQDGISYATTRAQGNGSGTNIYQNSSQATDQMASKVLDSTINIPPTVLINQGDQISIQLSRDLDFSRVYSLAPN